MFAIIFCAILLVVLGVYEQIKHNKNVKKIPIRVNVNGTRGKSTATRLITGILQEAGYKVIGKTTGTAARMIYWDKEEEKPIKRKIEGPNIKEQIKVIKEAADYGAEALVCECMAVHPEYQKVYQEKMIKANIGVIVNVLEDHLDVMGPTTDEIAEAFTSTIPYKGHLVISDGPYAEYFKKIAKKRKTKVIVADTSKVTEEYLRKFDYVIFPQNVALGLAFAEAMGIDEETAKRGMLKAHPDPGVLRIHDIGVDKPLYFVNGFAANEAASTLAIWERIKELGYPTDNSVLIMNCRPDRVDRTEQFAEDVFPYIEADSLIVIGERTEPVVKGFEKGKYPIKNLLRFENYTAEQIYEYLIQNHSNTIVFGVGNLHGSGEPLCKLFEEAGERNKYLIENQEDIIQEAGITI